MLTFLFTDIEGHSALWDSHPTAMAAALREHDELVAAAVAAANGRVVKNVGDGVMAVFADAERAVDAAVSMQRTLGARAWTDIGHLRVRMGLHVGAYEARSDDYFGPDVIRAARLCQSAHGGQVVASREVVALVSGRTWLSLGSHRLRGFVAPTEIHQLVAEGIGERFPALRTVDAHPNTLPHFRTEFVGREREIASLRDLLRSHQVVTLTGIGGAGKTRLAVEVAHAMLGTFPDGVYFADLSTVFDPEQIWQAVLAAFDVDTRAIVPPGEPPREFVLRFLATRRALLVLDNCEHLLDAAADVVEDVVDTNRSVAVLTTSREGLHIEGERMVQVPSMNLESDALRLFDERAAAAGALDVDRDVARRICERLDGLPLAIELAAARCAQLGAAEVADRLADRFRLLTGSSRRVPRQRTLEATLDWSHDQLGDDERSGLRRLSVFAGTFSLAAAENVAGADVDLMASLVEKSLVQPTEEGRFRLLETVRAYGEHKLLDAGETESIRRAQVRWLLDEIDTFSDEEVVFRAPRSDRFLRSEIENIYTAVSWSVDRADWATVARLAGYAGLAGGLTGRAVYRPLVGYVIDVLDHDVGDGPRDLALAAFTTVAYLDARGNERVDLWAEAATSGWNGRDGLAVVSLSWTANALDGVSRARGRPEGTERAHQLIQRAGDIAAGLGREWEALPALVEASLALNAGDWPLAADRADCAMALREGSELGRPIAFELFIQAIARMAAGRPFTRAELRRRGDRVDHLGNEAYLAAYDAFLAAYSAPEPNGPRAPIHVERWAIDASPAVHGTSFVIATAALAARAGDWPIAARLLAAASAPGGVFSGAADVALYRITVPAVRGALDKPTAEALREEGRAMGLAEAVDLAIRWLAME